MTTIFEVSSIADRGNHRGCSLGTDPADLGNALARVIGFEDGINLFVEEADARIDLKQELIQTGDDLSGQGREVFVWLSEDLWDHAPSSGSGYPNRNPAIEK